MTTLDELTGRAVAHLDRVATAHVDVDEGLRRLAEGERPIVVRPIGAGAHRPGGTGVAGRASGRSAGSHRLPVWLGAAAAAVVGITGFALWRSQPEGSVASPEVTAPLTSDIPVTSIPGTATPGTAAPVTAVPDTTPVTTAAPTTAPSTTAPAVVDLSGPWPAFDPTSVADAPRPSLLPDVAVPGLTLVRDDGWERQPTGDRSYDQFLRTTDGSSILLRISTYRADTANPSIGPLGPTVPIGPWTAEEVDTLVGYTFLRLHAEEGIVELWASNASYDDAAEIAARLTRRTGDVPGWDLLPAADGVDRWSPWSEGWNTPELVDRLLWLDADGQLVAELQYGCCVLSGLLSRVAQPDLLGVERDPTTTGGLGTVTVSTQTLVGIGYAGWVERPPSGGVYGPGVEAVFITLDGGPEIVDLVDSLRVVDPATWSAIPEDTVVVTDECRSLLC